MNEIPSGVKTRLARILQKRTWGKPADHALAEVNEVLTDLDAQGYVTIPRETLNELCLCAVAFLQPHTRMTVIPNRGILYAYMTHLGWKDGDISDHWTKNI